MEENIPLIRCNLERIFPLGFLNCMEHLPILLPYEARVEGPIRYNWMYSFERFLHLLKQMLKNKACVEGSICEAYLCQEMAHFFSYYFESHVPCMRNRSRRNYDISENENFCPTLLVFSSHGRPSGKPKRRYLSGREIEAAFC